jgi:hypothetical protein
VSDQKEQHPWAKYYAERGQSRVAMAQLAPRPAPKPAAAPPRPADSKTPALSSELAAAVAAATAQATAAGYTAAPFITSMQKEALAREAKHRTRIRIVQFAVAAAIVLTGLHLTLTRTIFRQPFESAVNAHVRDLPTALLPLYSSLRVPLQGDGVTIAQADRIDADNYRYVATVTLRLRKPLFIPAVSNGTAAYRRLRETLHAARDQELRYNLFPPSSRPIFPELPLLLQRVHQAGETIVVRVPFTARRFGWNWRLAAPHLELRTANRVLEGDSLERYTGAPVLIYGDSSTLADIRARVKKANEYVLAVAKTVQRQAYVVAVAAPPVVVPIQPDDATLPPAEDDAGVPGGFDPNAPAVEEAVAHKPAVLTSLHVTGRR